MTRRSLEPSSPHHVYLYDADWDYLTERFGTRGFGSQRVGVGPAIRSIIHAWVKATRAREIRRISAVADETEKDLENA